VLRIIKLLLAHIGVFMTNKKIIIGSVLLAFESDTSVLLTIVGKDGKTTTTKMILSEAGELGQTLTNWVFKSILD